MKDSTLFETKTTKENAMNIGQKEKRNYIACINKSCCMMEMKPRTQVHDIRKGKVTRCHKNIYSTMRKMALREIKMC